MNKIGVGVVGASPLNPGWAVTAHLPALRALPDFELRAVSASRRESANAAAAAFGVAAFDNHQDLIAHPRVDLVVVTVKVTHHDEIVAAALDAGKMVFCEWPLGVSSAKASALAGRARDAGLRTAVGLQARFAPAIRHARDLVADGYIGEVLATTLVGSGISWGPISDRAHAYLFDPVNGATTLSVPTLHALDALSFVLGDFAEVSARLAVRRTSVHLADEARDIPVTAPDHLAILGALQSGALVSMFYRGGVSRGDNFRWEINGTKGDLVLTSPIGNVQVLNPRLEAGRGEDTTTVHEITPPPSSLDAFNVPEGPAGNVARLYAQFARDLRDGTLIVPDFAHAVSRHRLLDAIALASRTGVVHQVPSVIS